MLKPFLLTLIALCLSISHAATATNQVVSFHAQVVTALNPHEHSCQLNVVHHNDLVANLVAAHQQKVVAVVVSEPQYCTHNQLVAFVNNHQQKVKVVVAKNAFKQFHVTGFNQTVVSCVQTVKQNGHVVSQKVVKEVRVVGLLSGGNARQVKVAVAACSL